MASRRPERIGSYRLIKPLGRGQICELWEVERGSDAQRLAMKLLPPERNPNRQLLSSLKHEYTVGRFLKHPNVIETIEFVSGDHFSYLIMELFSGSNLKQLILDGVERIAYLAENIIRGAAAGLEYVHQKGWIHCDVKPDNFLVDRQGNAKLIDFNIAQKRKGALTRLIPGKSKVQGTQSYMSPEQIRGKAVDERSDIYSFGCLVHELISGKLPFTGSTSAELLKKHLRSRPTSLTAIDSNVDPDFANLVLRTMAKDPTDRPASMGEFLAALGEVSLFLKKPASPSEAT